MPHVFLGVGSNIDRVNNIRRALAALNNVVDDMKFSPVYESQALGFEGDNFYNFVISACTTLTLPVLAKALRSIELDLGRSVDAIKYSSRKIDIDILTYDELVGEFDGVVLPREELLTSAYVLYPLKDLAPDSFHPALNETYQALYEKTSFFNQKLRVIDFDFKTVLA